MAPAHRPIHIVGVPLDLGTGRRGVDMGPSAIRLTGLGPRLARLGHEVIDHGDISSPGQETRLPGSEQKRYIEAIADVCRRLYERALLSFEAGAMPVVLGGDHSLAAGSVAAAAVAAARDARPLGLLWLDAHGDMNTPESSTSGNVHGMPLAALVSGQPEELASLGGHDRIVAPDRTVLLGVRDIDEREKALISGSGVHVFTMSDIDREGLPTVVSRALAIATRDNARLHVSLDVDMCDPAIAPGVGTPVRGGVLYREAHFLMECLADTGRVASMDLVEVNPILDVRNATAELGADLLLSAFGKRIL